MRTNSIVFVLPLFEVLFSVLVGSKGVNPLTLPMRNTSIGNLNKNGGGGF